ncbi:MAG: hypothetical protein OEX00_09445 [Gammaproteobacteria bacterium]|nr:hypothetical protein [Gammaproteobacteria bacterium]MDH5694306.1 hypothetical protein [Gammaproteobacteria bacterium]
MSNPNYLIDQGLLEFLESDIAILVATRDSSNQPIISRGFGIRVSDDCTQLTVFLTDIQSRQLIHDALQSDHLAVNAANVTNYESYQIKGRHVQQVELNRKDERHISKYLRGIQEQMMLVGVSPEQAATIFQSAESQKLLALQFTAHEVFHQTPGPGAGKSRPQPE